MLTHHKLEFCSKLDKVVEGVPVDERVVIGAYLNGHVGEDSMGDDEVHGRYGVKDRDAGRQRLCKEDRNGCCLRYRV